MVKRKTAPAAEPVTGVDLSSGPDQTVIVWKATRPLTVQEHEDLSAKLKYEEQETGLKIILVPYTVEAERQQAEPENE